LRKELPLAIGSPTWKATVTTTIESTEDATDGVTKEVIHTSLDEPAVDICRVPGVIGHLHMIHMLNTIPMCPTV